VTPSVEKNSKLSKVFPAPPMVAFKQTNNLRNLLVRADISKPIGKSHSCGDTRCKCCKHMQHSFHSVEFLETVIRESEVLAHRKK
jgi:hypothetical protein